MQSTDRIKAGFVINDRFEIVKKVGEGGFAMVFEGRDLNLDRQVAIKVLHGALLGGGDEREKDVLERFEREARLAATVDHGSIVKIYDVGEIEGVNEPFIVMEYLRGCSLQDHIDKHGGMEPKKLLSLYQDLLVGLGFAHEAGIVHKDLKPENIFYRHPDTIRESLCVVDFGIAHIGRSNSQRVTRDGEFFGTPSYMAPEYISDQKVSPALDVYQLGLILVEGLTGRVLIDHPEPVATLLAHLSQNYKIPDCILESPLGPVLLKSLAPEPKDRYRDAMEFAEALARIDPSSVPTLETIQREYDTELGLDEDTLAAEVPMGDAFLGDEPSDIDTTNVSKWVHESGGYSHTIPGLGGLLPPNVDAPDWNSNPTPYGGFAAISRSMRKESFDPQELEEPVGLGFAPTEPADDSMLPAPAESAVGDDSSDAEEQSQATPSARKSGTKVRTRTNSARETRKEQPRAQENPTEKERVFKETEEVSASRTHISAPLSRPPASEAPEEFAKPPSRILPLAAFGLLLLGVILLGVAMMYDGGKEEDKEKTSDNTSEAIAAQDTTATSPPRETSAPNNTATAIENAPKETTSNTAAAIEEPPEATAIELVSMPAHAKVFHDGTFMGQTPYTVKFAPEAKDALTFSLRYKGYEDLEVTVGPGDGPSSKHEMQRKKEKPKKVRSGESKKPEETTPPKETKPEVLLPK